MGGRWEGVVRVKMIYIVYVYESVTMKPVIMYN